MNEKILLVKSLDLLPPYSFMSYSSYRFAIGLVTDLCRSSFSAIFCYIISINHLVLVIAQVFSHWWIARKNDSMNHKLWLCFVDQYSFSPLQVS